MKLSIYSLGMIGLLLAFSACTDLDVQPQSITTSEVIFADESAYEQFIARVYAGLAVTGQQGPAGQADISSLDEGFSQYLRVYWQLQELTTENAVLAWNDEGVPEISNHAWTSGNQFMRAMYYRVFYQVSIANEFLRETTVAKLDSRTVSDGTRADIRLYRAEARFLRALSYWHGIDLFGAIPLYTEEDPFGAAPPLQATRTEVFDYIESELAAIEPDMAAPGTNPYGRADQAALWMLQAKLFLNAAVYTGRERYTDVITATNKITSSGAFALDEEYRTMFMADNHRSSEFIFAVPCDGENTQSFGATTYLVHAPIGGSMTPANYGIDFGWGGLRTTSALVNLFPDAEGTIDERAIFYTEGQTKDINAITTFTDGYAVPKYTNITSEGEPGSDETHPDTDFPMFRLADAYLMYAEAVLRGGGGGDMATALGYINALRQRAYNNNNGNITQGDLTLDFILDERNRELYWEGHRRQDRIRFGVFTDAGIWPWKGGVKEGRLTEAFRNLFPLPAAELIANPNLSQNDGY